MRSASLPHALLALSFLAGCSSSDPASEASSPPAASAVVAESPLNDAGAPPVDAAPAGKAISGQWQFAYLTESGERIEPYDFTIKGVEAFVPNATGYDVVQGAGDALGSFRVPGVSSASAPLIRIGTNYNMPVKDDYPVVNVYLGRPGRATATAGSKLDLSVAGMSAYDPNTDAIVAFSAGASLATAGFEQRSAAVIPVGATTLSLGVDYASYSLINGAAGDRLRLTHMRAKPGTPCMTALESVELPSFTMGSGTTTAVTGTFAPTPENKSFNAVWKRQINEAHRADVHPLARIDRQGLQLVALPGLEKYGPYTEGAVVFGCGAIDTLDEPIVMTYGLPYTYGASVLSFAEYAIEVAAPGAQPAVEYLAIQSREAPTTASVGGTISPPRNLKLDGSTAVAPLDKVATTPVISWDPPTVGAVKSTIVSISELRVNEGKTQVHLVTSIYASDITSVRVPAGVLEVGKSYVVKIHVKTYARTFAEAMHLGISLPSGSAEALTSAFTVR